MDRGGEEGGVGRKDNILKNGVQGGPLGVLRRRGERRQMEKRDFQKGARPRRGQTLGNVREEEERKRGREEERRRCVGGGEEEWRRGREEERKRGGEEERKSGGEMGKYVGRLLHV